MAYPGPAYQSSAVPAVPYTDWLHRVGGYLIDVAPVIILEIIGGATGHFSIYFLFLLIALAYSVYNRWFLAGTTGQSFGKKALGLKLVSEDTGQPTKSAGIAQLEAAAVAAVTEITARHP